MVNRRLITLFSASWMASRALAAHASTQLDESDSQKSSADLQEVIVTGTNLRGVQPASPVISIERKEIEKSGYTSTGDLMRSLPESFPGGLNVTVLGASGAQNILSASGASTVNLRGLGSDSTLTLVNDHRMAFADTISATDITGIPLVAIERVDVLTDGGSAIYGSDAVAGVVNFKLRDRFDGIETRASLGDSTDGGGFQQTYSLAGGTRWGSGGLMGAYEHQHQGAIDTGDRSFIDPILAGTSLTPKTNRDSFYLGGSSDLGPVVSTHWDALLTNRTADLGTNEGFFLPGAFSTSHASVLQYSASDELEAAINERWHVAVQGVAAGQRNDNTNLTTVGSFVLSQEEVRYHTGLQSVQAKVDGEPFALPTGAVNLALGTGIRRESFDLSSTPESPATAISHKDRRVGFAFGEFSLPLIAADAARTGLNSLDLDAAGRCEHYSDFGSACTPKVGLIYQAYPDLKFTGSWGKSFRAPSLLQEYLPVTAVLQPAVDPTAPFGFSNILSVTGGSAHLTPEKANSWTVGGEFKPHELPGALLSVHLFHIDYRDRIELPVLSTYGALVDPLAADFIDHNPSAALQSQLIASSAQFMNLTGAPYDPATVAAVVDDRYHNVASQHARGVDLLGQYTLESAVGQFAVSLNATWLRLTQVAVPGSASLTLNGTVFSPPNFRARGSAGWELAGWSLVGYLNYVGPSKDNSAVPETPIASWTTVDAQLAYHFGGYAVLKDASVSLSVQNLTDARPPYVSAVASTAPGLNFDTTNASGIGRFVTLGLVTRW